MMPAIERKPDSGEIEAFLTKQSQWSWIKRGSRRFWPHYLFHYTDIRNITSILQAGYLYSRSLAERWRTLVTSAGDPRILQSTDTLVKRCVRFYFRPQTPTQYYAEGIRSRNSLIYSRFPQAHCPVPIFLLFDAAQVLTMASCRFAEGSLRYYESERFDRVEMLSTADELARLPWWAIYHNSPTPQDDRKIAFHRNAEVVVPHMVSLSMLKHIICRSEAEMETLQNHLRTGPATWQKYRDMVVWPTPYELFLKRHTYVDRAELGKEHCTFHFSPETDSPGPFSLAVEFRPTEGRAGHFRRTYTIRPDQPWLRLRLPQGSGSYGVCLHLDHHLAYTGVFDGT